MCPKKELKRHVCKYRYSLLHKLVIRDCPVLAGKDYANFVNSTPIGTPWQCIAIAVNLSQGLFGGAIKFKLHYIDIAIGLCHHINASSAYAHFTSCVNAKHLEILYC